ncbi:probable G-protein coupled receptor 75 [Littorina saxatilis]|uniref:G-protein coupled receptors family 1 profile domain-containing protein n=1 Tax=Littorina saxatilis TaxID=31220 RepID=A0AAN9GEX9_9CAEN
MHTPERGAEEGIKEEPYHLVMGEWSWEAAFHGSVHTATLAVATVLALFVLLLGSFGNGLVLVSALRRRKVRTNFDLLILNLSTADLLLCVLLAPLYLYTLFADPPSPKVFCGSLLFGGTGCGLLSLLSIVAVAIHRQARVVGRAKRSLTSRQTGLVLAAVWALSGAGAVGATLHAMLDWRDSYNNCQVLLYSRDPLLHRFTLFFLGPLVVVSFIVIVVSYVVIARAVRAQSRARTQGLPALYRSAPIYRSAGLGRPLDPLVDKANTKQAEPLVLEKTLSKPTDSLGQERTFSKPTDPLVPSKAFSAKQTEHQKRTSKKKHRKNPATTSDGASRQCHCCSCQAALERENKAVTMCLVVILTLVLCWSPLLVSQFIELATGPSIILLQVKLCGIALVFLNSALDPYMYAQSQGHSKSRYGRLFWDVLRCQCANPGRTRFRTLRARPVGPGPPRSSLLEVDTPSLLAVPPPPPERGVGGVAVKNREGERGEKGGREFLVEEGMRVKCGVGEGRYPLPGNDAPSPGNQNQKWPRKPAGQHGALCSNNPVSVLGLGNWQTVLDQRTHFTTNTTTTATNTATTGCRHVCRTKDVMRDVKTLVHKSCCHAGHVPSDQSLVES